VAGAGALARGAGVGYHRGQMEGDHLVTQLLADVAAGKNGAAEQLVEVVYAELHRLAQGYMRKERVGHTLQATALVNEA